MCQFNERVDAGAFTGSESIDRSTGARPYRAICARLSAGIALTFVLGGCLSLSEQTVFGDLGADETYRLLVRDSPYGMAPDLDVLAMTPEMAAIAAEVRRSGSTERARLAKLSELFTPHQGLDLEYDALATYTASETLDRQAGNCLAFTHLFVAIAREVGLDARYREMHGILRWDEVGDFVLLNRHVGAYGELQWYGTYQADFGQIENRDDRFGGVISDDRARAQHFNNLGARALTRGESHQAVRYFNRALTIDRVPSYIWSNLGTAYARLGDPQLAEHAYRQALRSNAYDATATAQLGRLYEQLGEEQLAAQYRDRSRRIAQQNPWRLFYEGVDAIADGDLNRAVDRLTRAARAQPDEMHFHLELGKALALRGNERRARDRFLRAAKLADEIEDQLAIRSALAELDELAAERREQRLQRHNGGALDTGMTQRFIPGER
jgi:Flp pilus assembly protein TadD